MGGPIELLSGMITRLRPDRLKIVAVSALILLAQIPRALAPLPPLSPSRGWELLQHISYRVERQLGHPGYGTLQTPDGQAFELVLMWPGDKAAEQASLTGLHLQTRYLPDRKPTARWLLSWLGSQQGNVRIKALINGEVQFTSQVPIEPWTSQPRLKKDIDDILTQWGRLTAELPPAAKGKKPQIEDDTILHLLDWDDAVLLVEHWGWTYRGGWGGSGPTWLWPATVGGVTLFLGGHHPGFEDRERTWIRTSVTLPPRAQYRGLSGRSSENSARKGDRPLLRKLALGGRTAGLLERDPRSRPEGEDGALCGRRCPVSSPQPVFIDRVLDETAS